MRSSQRFVVVVLTAALACAAGRSTPSQSWPTVSSSLGPTSMAPAPADAAAELKAEHGDPRTTCLFYSSLHWFGSFQAEGVRNMKGGLRLGTAFDDKLGVGFSAQTEELGLWKGGEFRASAQQLVGHDPSGRFVGDAQGLSNIASRTSVRLYDCWFCQHLPGGKAQIKAGLLDLNATFMVVDSAALLINSSFGVMPTLSGNIVASIFPKPGFGVIAEEGGPLWSGRMGLFQGDPARRDSLFCRGYTWISEGSRCWEGKDGLNGVVKVGVWKYNGDTSASTPAGAWGAYASAEQRVFAPGPGGLTLFVQASTDPPGIHPVLDYLGCGFDWLAPFPSRQRDHFVGGIARAKLGGAPYGTETAYELAYIAVLGERFSFQPDLQVIVHPGGVYPTAWTLTFRVVANLF